MEPQDDLKAHVQDLLGGDLLDGGRKIQWINCGASDRAGTLAFTMTGSDGSCSFAYSAEEARALGFEQRAVPVRTVNEIVALVGAGLPEMVKIDAEGLDLKVLEGASELLGKTDIFLVEVVLRGGRGYENTVADVMKFMTNAGYWLMEITDLNRSPKYGVLWLCELAFLRNGSTLLDAASSYE